MRIRDELLDPIVVLCVCEKRPEHALRPPGGAARLYASEDTRRSTASAAASISSPGSWSNRPRTQRETISGSVVSGRPTPTRTRVNSPLPEALLQRLQPVVARKPTAGPDLDLAEGQVDLVVYRDHVVEVEPERAARRPDRRCRTRSCTSEASSNRDSSARLW